MTFRSHCVSRQDISESHRGTRGTDPLAASIWAVNAAIQAGHDDAVDEIVREGEAVLASRCSS